jgi:hypothetical protein
MGEPFQVMAAGCGGFVHHAGVAPSHCEAEPTVVGLVMFRRRDARRAAWRAFTCDRHADHLIAPRPLLPRDRDVLAWRRDDRLVERARAWEQRHAETRQPRSDGAVEARP